MNCFCHSNIMIALKREPTKDMNQFLDLPQVLSLSLHLIRKADIHLLLTWEEGGEQKDRHQTEGECLSLLLLKDTPLHSHPHTLIPHLVVPLFQPPWKIFVLDLKKEWHFQTALHITFGKFLFFGFLKLKFTVATHQI